MWDYSAPADYFITICTQNRLHLFGSVVNGKMVLSENGRIVASEIQKMPTYHKRIILNAWVVMPNHIHLIVTLGNYEFDNEISSVGNNNHNTYIHKGHNDNRRDDNASVDKNHEFYLQLSTPVTSTPTYIKQYRKLRRKMLIPIILGKLQQQTSKQINILHNTPGTKNWQADYHDHIIRTSADYIRINNYIINNPLNWSNDVFKN